MKRSRHIHGTKRTRHNSGTPENSDDPDAANGDDSVVQIENNIYFYGVVDKRSIVLLVKGLAAANAEALKYAYSPSDARVYLYIHSPGGEAFVGLSAMDHIRLNPVSVVAIADGFVASAATFILLGAPERKAMANAKILIHQLSTGFWGKYSDLIDEMKNSKELMSTIKTVYQTRTHLSSKQLNRLLKKELHMSASGALTAGLIDEIW